MKEGTVYATTVGRLLQWAQANALSYYSTGSACCADEVLCARSARYDLERFGSLPQTDPMHADLLLVTGAVSYKSAQHLREIYDAMTAPKFVMSIGSCANCGGIFGPDVSYAVVPGIDRIVPVDVYVPGCPPRPEAIMEGLLTLQQKIRGGDRDDRATP